MPDFQFGFLHVAQELGANTVGYAVEEEQGVELSSSAYVAPLKLTVQLTSKGVMIYTPKQGAFFTAADVQLKPVAPPPTGVLQVRDIRSQLPRANAGNLDTRSLAACTHLVVHWDGGVPDPFIQGYDPLTYYKNEANYHINKNWGTAGQPAYGHGLMYHYKVDRSGQLYWTRALTDIVWACMGANGFSVNVCVDATNGAEAIDKQIDAVHALAKHLFHERPDLPNMVEGNLAAHGELIQYGNSTSCPGPKLRGFVHQYVGS